MNAYANHVVSYLLAQSWQVALLAAIVGLISLALRNRTAHIRYLLWLVVLAKCLVPPVLTVPLAVLPERSSSPSPALLDLPQENSAPEVLVSADGAPKPRESARAMPSTRELIALIWIAGISIFLFWVGGRAVRYTAWLRERRRPLPPALQESIQELSPGFKFRKSPRIWLLEDIRQPFVWGLLRGSVYLPTDFVGLSGSDQQRSILAHELSHIARFDAGVNLLQVLAQAAYWFHPLVWWANRKIRQEREKCCDEMAVVHLNTPPEHYTEAIVDALAAERRSTHPIPSLAIVGSVKDIEERIKTMLKPGKTFRRCPSLAAVTIASLLALVTAPTALVLTARGQAQPPTQSARQPGAAGERPEQPPFAARTFNSTIPFEVLVQERGLPHLSPRSIGLTPSTAPLEIPSCVIWWVRPTTPVKDWESLLREIRQSEIPGLILDSAKDSDARHLADSTSLKGLYLNGTEITDAGLAHLKGLTGLQFLSVGGSKITDAGLAHLKGLTRLQSLRLGGSTRVTDASLADLKGLTELRGLGLYGTQITDAGLVHLKDLTRLQFLNLTYTQVTDAGLTHLKGFTALRTLTLDGTRVTDAGLVHLKGLTGLAKLVLSGDKITDTGLVYLKGLTGLQQLDLSGTQITDAGLLLLKGMSRLQRLDLGGTQITDAGLVNLKDLTGLKVLTLERTRVTDAGIKQLKQSLPELSIGKREQTR